MFISLNKKIKIILLGIFCCLGFSLFYNIIFIEIASLGEFFKPIDLYFYHAFFLSKSEPSKQLQLIDCNDPGENRSRSEYAEMVRRLNKAGANCIAIDILFDHNRTQSSFDNQQLVAAVESCSCVILAISFESAEQPGDSTRMIMKKFALPDSLIAGVFAIPGPAKGVVLPYDKLLAAASYIGHVNAIKGESYHFPLFIKFEGEYFPALPLEVYRCLLKNQGKKCWLSNIPTDIDGQLRVNLIEKDQFSRIISWDDALVSLKNAPNANLTFSDKIILLINPAAEDFVAIPGNPRYPKWAVLASIVSQFVENKHIYCSPIFYPTVLAIFLIVIGAIWILFISARLQGKWQFLILFGVLNFLLIFFVYLIFRGFYVWLGAVTPVLVYNSSVIIVHLYSLTTVKAQKFSDFVIHILERKGKYYPIKVSQSEMGEEEGDAAFKTILDEEKFHENMDYIRKFQANREEIRWIGEKLFNSLFKGELFYLLKACLENAIRSKRMLRIKLVIDPYEMSALPWELMHSTSLSPGFLTLNKHISLVRHISLSRPAKNIKFKVPLKVLVLGASPAGFKELQINKEIQLIKRALRPLIWGQDVRLRIIKQATLEDLYTELNQLPDIIHFIGHSAFDSSKNTACIYFENEKHEKDTIDEETFGNLLYESSVKLVLLNSCESAAAASTNIFSGIGPNLVKAGVPAVLGMQFPISDESALLFCRIFYTQFLSTHSIDIAVSEARRFLMTKTRVSGPDWAIPVIFSHSNDFDFFSR